MDLPRESRALQTSTPSGIFAVIDDVLDPLACDDLIRSAAEQSWMSTTCELSGQTLPRRVADPDLPCRFVDDDERPPFAAIVDPLLALRLFYRLEAHLPKSLGDSLLSGLKPLMRCVHLRAGEATSTHREALRACSDGQLSALSFALFLNDEFQGGGLEFPSAARRVLPRTGRMVVFANDHLHGDALVTHGDRYTLEGEIFYAHSWRPYR